MDYAGIEVDEHKVVDLSNKEDLNFAQKYKLQTFPTLLKLDDNGEELGRLCGLQPLSKIKDFVK